jgi:nitroreductase
MKALTIVLALLLSAGIILPQTPAMAQDLKTIELPTPTREGGMPLMEALNNRQTGREYATRDLSLQMQSDLLWAAFGINREDGKRTAPSAVNWQEIDVYMARKDGIYLYDEQKSTLEPVLAGDHRMATGQQDFVGVAPLNLIYVADYTRITGDRDDSTKLMLSSADTGFISQNVYLFCASEGLSTVVRGLVDRDTLKPLMGLRADQHITFCQTVGFPQ